MTKDMSHMILKLIVLRRIEKGEVYSYALIKEFDNKKISGLLKKPGKNVKNDIYNTVKALQKSGYITMKAKVDGNKLKKYYYLTSEGKRAVGESKKLFIKSMKELMEIIR